MLVTVAAEADTERPLEPPVESPEIRVTVTATPLVVADPLETQLRLPAAPLPEESLPEVVARLPGLSLSSYSEEPREAAVQFRGYGSSHLSVVIDGHSVNPPDLGRLPWGSVPLGAVESVTLLRGPRVSRYGSGAVTGALVVDTTPRDPGGHMEGSLGSFGYLSAAAGVTAELGGAGPRAESVGPEDTSPTGASSLVSASGELFRRDGQRENSQSSGGSAFVSFRGPRTPGAWSPGPQFRASLGYSEAEYGLPGAISPEELDEDPNASGTPEDQGNTSRIAATGELAWVGAASELEIPLYGAFRSDRSDFVSFATETATETLTVRIEPSVSRELFLADGAELALGIVGEVVRLASTASSGTTTEQLFLRPAGAIWGRGDLGFAELWSVEIGARVDLAQLRASGEIDDSTRFAGLGGDAALSHRTALSESTLRLAAVYRLPKIDEIALYQGFGSGFNADLGPERGVAADLGSRATVLDALSLRVGLFGVLLWDEIAFVFDPTATQPPYGQNENIDSTRRLGVEAEADLELTNGLGLFGGYSFVDARYQSGEFVGNLISGVPQHQATMSVIWEPLPWLDVTTTYQLAGGFYDNPGNEGSPEYRRDLLGVTVSTTLPAGSVDWVVSMAAENLLDDRDPTVAFPGAVYPSSGRSFEVSLRGEY